MRGVIDQRALTVRIFRVDLSLSMNKSTDSVERIRLLFQALLLALRTETASRICECLE
jgi:hypothetical protein